VSSSFDVAGVGGNCLHCEGDAYAWSLAMGQWLSAVNGRTPCDAINCLDLQPGLAGSYGLADTVGQGVTIRCGF